jgi:hypothetical protein
LIQTISFISFVKGIESEAKKQQRKESVIKQGQKENFEKAQRFASVSNWPDEELKDETSETNLVDPDFEAPEVRQPKHNTLPLPNFAQFCERANLSDSMAALGANSLLTDYNILQDQPNLAVSTGKMASQRSILHMSYTERVHEPLEALYYDGKKYDTLHQESISSSTLHQFTRKEEHIIAFDPMSGNYVTEFRPELSTGACISIRLMQSVR